MMKPSRELLRRPGAIEAALRAAGAPIKATAADLTPADRARIAREVAESIGRAGLEQTVSDLFPGSAASRRELPAMIAFVDAVRAGELLLSVDRSFVGAEAFAQFSTALGLSQATSDVMYTAVAQQWRTRVQAMPRASRLQQFMRLLSAGLDSRQRVLEVPASGVAQLTGSSESAAISLREWTLRRPDLSSVVDLIPVDVKIYAHVCCPPFDSPEWSERFAFFGANSRLQVLVGMLKEQIEQRIQQIFIQFVTANVRQAAGDFGVGVAANFDSGDAGAPFFGSNEAIQSLDDLGTKQTRAELQAWIDNFRKQLAWVRDRLNIDGINSLIFTSNEDDWGTGGGDGDLVDLNVMGASGVILDVAASDEGGGFPIDSSNYNDGALAFRFFGTGVVAEPIPFPGGVIRALDVTGFQLRYGSTNDWLFEKAEIWFRYQVNAHSSLLTTGQDPDPDLIMGGDQAHLDTAPGWVHLGDEFNFGIRSGSRLELAKQRFRRLETFIDNVEASLSAPDLDNVYIQHGDELIDLLPRAAEQTARGEHTLARGLYRQALQILAALDANALSDLDRELLLAIHALLADSYLRSGTVSYAYSELFEAYHLLSPGDTESRDYLWHRFADLFLRWGDQLYAAAGPDYVARLDALSRYAKVVGRTMLLTYIDGVEDEVLDFWVDLWRDDGVPPPDVAVWFQRLTIRPIEIVEGLQSSGVLPGFPPAFPVLEALDVRSPNGAHFLRLRLDVSEVKLRRSTLDITIVNSAAAVAAWQPTRWRIQAHYDVYNPTADRTGNGMHGPNHDLEAIDGVLDAPTQTLDSATWVVSSSSRIFAIDNPLPAPGGCASTMVQREAQLRIDQIRAHLNVFGLHDEYVPSSRFQTLGSLAATLADRAAYFNERYVDFLGRGEAEVLDELDTAFMQELSAANEEIARNRVAASQTEFEAAQAASGAAVRINDLAQAALTDFENSYSPGFVRMLNSISIGLPPSVSMNFGGFVGSVSGADGYDAQFNARRNEMAAQVEQALAAAEAAGFRVRLAEIEKLVAQESVEIEQARGRHLEDRLNFLRNRVLNATFWYQTAAIYRVLAETQVRAAARYAWMAERALEFETNLPAGVVRMDYHLIPLGAERLRADIDRLRALLVEFRERYRDIPNVIEREFRFSVEFPDQFRALTVNDASASQAAESLGPGVRAVEFRTAMRLYDERLPGRYAFGRVLGVEVELHTDVAPGVFTGHVENARVITVAGKPKRVQVSESWVRVPEPEMIEVPDPCPPVFDLDDTIVIVKRPPKDHGHWDIHAGLVAAVAEKPGPPPVKAVEVRVDPAPVMALTADTPTSRFTRRSVRFVETRQRVRALAPLVNEVMGAALSHIVTRRAAGLQLAAGQAEALLARAANVGVSAADIQFAARTLVSDDHVDNAADLRQLRERQIPRLRERLASVYPDCDLQLTPNDLDALLALRSSLDLFSANTWNDHVARARFSPGGRSWRELRVSLETPEPRVTFRDYTPGHGAARRHDLDVLPDYITYPANGPKYGMKLKRHPADSLTLSTFDRQQDIVVYNPYNSTDHLGVFENTGIDSYWRLTLRALPVTRLHRTPQWDKLREVIFRVWYHAAYEREAGFELAEQLEPQVVRLDQEKVLDLSFYRDFYDEFQGLVGDYDSGDPVSLAAVRAFSDQSHAATGGWIEFRIDDTLIPLPGQRISAVLLLFTANEASTFPDFQWQLRYGTAGPTFAGRARGDAGALAQAMSVAAPAGFRGLEPRGSWFFRLAAADNAGRDIGRIQDIELVIELEPI